VIWPLRRLFQLRPLPLRLLRTFLRWLRTLRELRVMEGTPDARRQCAHSYICSWRCAAGGDTTTCIANIHHRRQLTVALNCDQSPQCVTDCRANVRLIVATNPTFYIADDSTLLTNQPAKLPRNFTRFKTTTTPWPNGFGYI